MKSLILTACVVLLSHTFMQAQEIKNKKKDNPKQENLYVKLKENAKPDIYLDGKKFDFRMELLDKNMIESVNVLKGEKALTEYNAPNGVILIMTKDKNKSDKTKSNFSHHGEAPLIIIDGKTSNQKTLESLDPDEIDNIEIFKGKKAIKKYNAANGAIIITTKQGK